MSDMTEGDEPSAPEATGPDWILPAAAAAFAIYYVISIRELRWDAMISALFVAAILGLLIVIFAIRTVLRLRGGRVRVAFAGALASREGVVRQAILLASIVAFIYIVPTLGFTLTVFGFLAISLIAIARMATARAVALAALVAIVGYLLFIVALQTQFPDGPFERALSPAVEMLRQRIAAF